MNIPKRLVTVSDQVIEQVKNRLALPPTISELTAWFETEGWDTLVPTFDDDEHIAVDLNHLASLAFWDSELIDAEDLDDDPVTDEIRVKYAREVIANALDQYDDDVCPSVHSVELRNRLGETAILGWLVEAHGQGGAVPVFQGAFRDQRHFHEDLRATNFLLDSHQDTLTDEVILQLWRHPPPPIRSISVQVEWGYEVHECPMAPKTWKRIIQGKPVRRVQKYKYEGRNYKAEWLFNAGKVGNLIVNYSDREDNEGVGFQGVLSEVLIQDNGKISSWTDELIEHGLKVPRNAGEHK
jgi:hypothetical protein